MSLLTRALSAYRATGADLPLQHPERAHGVAMEGYFWRITTPERSAIALIGVNRGPRGPWATLGLALSPGAHTPAGLVTAAVDGAWAAPEALGAGSGHHFVGTDRTLRVRLPNGELDATFTDPTRWPHRLWGGSSLFQAVPALNQYWHPWLLGARASGRVLLGGDAWEFADAQVYGEKNWGRGGFPEAWWWGQAHAFDEREACVAFAGGQIHFGPLRTEVTGLVVRLPDGTVVRLGNPGTSPVTATIHDESWVLRGRSRTWTIEVDAHAPLGAAHVLPVPLPGEHRNTPGALEHLHGSITVTVRRDGRTVWRGTSRMAGLEHGGLARAEAELARRGGDPRPLS